MFSFSIGLYAKNICNFWLYIFTNVPKAAFIMKRGSFKENSKLHFFRNFPFSSKNFLKFSWSFSEFRQKIIVRFVKIVFLASRGTLWGTLYICRKLSYLILLFSRDFPQFFWETQRQISGLLAKTYRIIKTLFYLSTEFS